MNLLPLYLISFIGSLGFSIVLPFLVYWLVDFGGSPALFGVMGATYSVFQLIGSPILGRASDRFGRKRILFLSQFGTLTAWIGVLAALYAPTSSLFSVESESWGSISFTVALIVLFLSRAFDGFTSGNISIANAYLAEMSTSETKSRDFGRMAAATSLGFILGPSIAGVLPSDKMAVYFAIAISLIGLLLIQFMLKESPKSKITKDPCGSQMRRLTGKAIRDCNDKVDHSLGAILKKPFVPTLFALYFFIYLGFNIFYSTFPVLAKENLTWDPKTLGYFFSVLSFVMVLVQSVLLPFAKKYFSDTVLFVVGCGLLAVSKGLLIFEGSYVWFVPIFFALGNGIMWPVFLTVLSAQGNENDQGSLQGYGSSFGSLASILGLIAGSAAFSVIGSDVFLWSAVIFTLVAFAGFTLRKASASAAT